MPDTAQASGIRNHCGRSGSQAPVSCFMFRVVIVVFALFILCGRPHTSLCACVFILRAGAVFAHAAGTIKRALRPLIYVSKGSVWEKNRLLRAGKVIPVQGGVCGGWNRRAGRPQREGGYAAPAGRVAALTRAWKRRARAAPRLAANGPLKARTSSSRREELDHTRNRRKRCCSGTRSLFDGGQRCKAHNRVCRPH
jgi:hypothetical protein